MLSPTYPSFLPLPRARRPEALFFLVLYVFYCVGMAFNTRIEEVVKARVPVPQSWNVSQAHASGVDGAAAGAVVIGVDDSSTATGSGGASSKQNGKLGVGNAKFFEFGNSLAQYSVHSKRQHAAQHNKAVTKLFQNCYGLAWP